MTDEGLEIDISERVLKEQKDYPFIDVGESMLAVRVSEPEDQFDLSSIPDLEDEALGADQFTDAYLLDDEGRRYWIRRNKRDQRVEIVDAEESRKAGGKLSISSVDPEEAEQKVLKIGESFSFGDKVTGPLTEIIAVNRRPDPSLQIPTGDSVEKSTVINDFVLDSVPIQQL